MPRTALASSKQWLAGWMDGREGNKEEREREEGRRKGGRKGGRREKKNEREEGREEAGFIFSRCSFPFHVISVLKLADVHFESRAANHISPSTSS